MENFIIFGSSDSQDIDVLVIVDEINDNPFYEIEKCKVYDKQIAEFLQTDKEVNSNLMIVKDGIINKVLKGSSDEVNNSLIDTYHLHKQYFDNPIKRRLERDVNLKIDRTIRVLLSLISKTEYRTIVKLALKNPNINDKIETLYQCDISHIIDLGNKNVDFIDFIKVYSFQIGQTLALMDGIELYSKIDIGNMYNNLKPFLQRDLNCDMKILNEWKNRLLYEIKKAL